MSRENKTPNLELNQWSGNEYPKRTDFIEDNKKIDEAYKELKNAVQKGGKVSSVNGKIGDVILKAEDIKTNSGATVESQMAEIIILSKDEPTTNNENTYWLQDVGENFSIPSGDGVVIANASFGDENPIKFELL